MLMKYSRDWKGQTWVSNVVTRKKISAKQDRFKRTILNSSHEQNCFRVEIMYYTKRETKKHRLRKIPEFFCANREVSICPAVRSWKHLACEIAIEKTRCYLPEMDKIQKGVRRKK